MEFSLQVKGSVVTKDLGTTTIEKKELLGGTWRKWEKFHQHGRNQIKAQR